MVVTVVSLLVDKNNEHDEIPEMKGSYNKNEMCKKIQHQRGITHNIFKIYTRKVLDDMQISHITNL